MTSRTVAGLPLVVGLGLGYWAVYTHLRIAEQLRAGRCDGCEPWHPLFVAALVGSAAFVLVSLVLFSRR
ncbi:MULTISPECIES: hypothetical protein [Halorussus]|uniref:hypothetical protein n=1 Tax=Halorussus TaxID=1070314 RepID=UPI00209EEBA5|nr:hypothetical protein [Halorussus vallis]USZ74201.1 hypothetical protein NGM07_12175 [Halorussus vallis]